MGTSAYSKGKGNRRFPGRDGGRGKQNNAQSWQLRATHAVENLQSLGKETTEFRYRGAWDKNASERIYILDQEFARAGILYTAELDTTRWHPEFTIFVPTAMREKAATIINTLEEKDRLPAEPQQMKKVAESAHFQTMCLLQPDEIPAHLKDNPWEFALYSEYDGPSRRFSNNILYRALVFRNSKQTVFGIKEWHDPGAPWNLAKMARRIVVDEDFRSSLIIDDPRASDIWKKLGLLPDH